MTRNSLSSSISNQEKSKSENKRHGRFSSAKSGRNILSTKSFRKSTTSETPCEIPNFEEVSSQKSYLKWLKSGGLNLFPQTMKKRLFRKNLLARMNSWHHSRQK